MKLTGIFAKAFQEWIFESYGYSQLNIDFFDEIHINSLIIEFMDSVGIYVSIIKEGDYFDAYLNDSWASASFKTRKDATNEVINIANEFYNEK